MKRVRAGRCDPNHIIQASDPNGVAKHTFRHG
jgi:hypothetical protein